MKKNLILKAALLSCAFVTASINAIAGNIPAMVAAFADTPLYLIELITTIPSLSSMAAVLLSSRIASSVGYKRTVLLGSLLAGIAGTAPYFMDNILLILVSRALFGFGAGLISSSLLILIVYFFNGQERSSMIGLQGSAGGLASLITTFIAGRLLVFGWNVSFLTYLFGFLVFLIVLFFVPAIGSIRTTPSRSTESSHSKGMVGLLGLSLLMFISVALATLFVIKCSTLAVEGGYADAGTGSLLVMCISAGSLIAGAVYGNMMNLLKKITLPVFYMICAAGFALGSVSSEVFTMMAAAFLLGFGYLAFVPFLQERVSTGYANLGAKGTSIVLVFQSLGAFTAPYLGSLLNSFTSALPAQFMICAGMYMILTAFSALIYAKK